MPPTNIEVVAQAYEALARADLDGFLGLVHSDVVLTQDDALPWGGRHVGYDGVTHFAMSLVGTIESAVSTEALFQAGDNVIQYGRTRGTVRTSGASFDIPECHVWTVRHGLVTEMAFFIDTGAMLAALAMHST